VVDFQALTGTGTPRTPVTHENNRGVSENAARPAAVPEPPTRPDGPSLSFYSIRELARWYEEQRDRRSGLDQDPLVRDLLQRLAEPGSSPYAIRDLANWYEEEANRRRVGTIIDQDALDRDLRRLLAEGGVFPEFIAVEFERVMQVVFAVPSDARARPWSGLTPRAVDQLAHEFSGLKASSAAELEDAIRTRLAKYVPAEAVDVEVEKMMRRIEALDDTDANFPAHAGRATEPDAYEVLGAAPPGEPDSIHPENAVQAEGQVPSRGLEPKLADAGGTTVDQLSIPDDLTIPKFLVREQARRDA
jgi:hypothetical protein